MIKEKKEVNVVSPDNQYLYSEREILNAWNEVGRKHNGLTLAWIFEKLRENKARNEGGLCITYLT